MSNLTRHSFNRIVGYAIWSSLVFKDGWFINNPLQLEVELCGV